jgi:hypothetical protein
MQAPGRHSSTPVHRSRRLHAIGWLLFIALAAAVLVPGTAVAGGFELEDYEVRLQPGEAPSQPTCTTNADGSQTCTIDQSFSFSDKTSTGTVTDKKSGKTGTIASTCDMSSQMLMTLNMPALSPGQSTPQTQTIVAADGHAKMSCNWEMRFSDGTMNCAIEGTMTLSKVNSGEIAFHGSMDVNVLAGTGSYGGLVGNGVWNQDQTIPVGGQGGPGGAGQPKGGAQPASPGGGQPTPPPSGEPPTPPPGGGPPTPPPGSGPPAPPPGGGSSLHFALGSAVAQAAGSGSSKSATQMTLRLHRGAARAHIVAPGATLATGATVSLRVASASHSQCKASASSAGRTVALGTAVDREGHGGVTFAGSLAARLGPGKWRLSATCSYVHAGKHLTTAPVLATVHIG